jgi:uncharacterized protein (TIGR02246 family)
MKQFLVQAALATAALTASTAATAGDADRHVRALLASYAEALNDSDTARAVDLYTDDGVFMPQHSLPSVGREAVRKAYEQVFSTIRLNVRFSIDEVVQMDTHWAFARTRSDGKVTVLASGVEASEANQELFLFRKDAKGDWKIARYIFSTTNPPRS